VCYGEKKTGKGGQPNLQKWRKNLSGIASGESLLEKSAT